MTTFDRYLLRRYIHVFAVGYLALFGLYFVIDVFNNVSQFFDQHKEVTEIFTELVFYYSYRACYFFGLIGGTLEVVSAMVAMALVQKHGELNPILSAGISTFRLIRTLLVGSFVVTCLIVIVQEVVIPRIAVNLQFDPAQQKQGIGKIDEVPDFATGMLIGGKLNLAQQKLDDAEFVLPPTKLTEKLTVIKAVEAIPQDKKHHHRVGWLLKGASVAYDELQLTDLGRRNIKRGTAPDELFIRSDVLFDRLYNRDSHYEYLSTWDLIHRLRNPSFSSRSQRTQNMFVQARLTKPLLNLVVVAVGVPFVVRKESVSVLTNLAVCCGVMTAMLGVNESYLYLGKANILAPEVAVWAPIITWGTAAAWLMGIVRT
jgi:lipopolysaccharide export system permease protein